MVADPGDDRLARQASLVAEVAGDEDPALAVELGIERAGEDLALEQPGRAVGDRQRRDACREGVPAGLVMDGDAANIAAIESAAIHSRHDLTARTAFIDRDNINRLISAAGFAGDGAVRSLDGEDRARGDRGPVSVSRVPECPSGRPLVDVAGSGDWDSRFPTIPHFAPPDGIIARRNAPSTPNFASRRTSLITTGIGRAAAAVAERPRRRRRALSCQMSVPGGLGTVFGNCLRARDRCSSRPTLTAG